MPELPRRYRILILPQPDLLRLRFLLCELITPSVLGGILPGAGASNISGGGNDLPVFLKKCQADGRNLQMKLAELMKPGGKGVIATAAPDGSMNTAIYAPPLLSDDGTAAWGMTEGRTYRNVRGNPNASYLYISPSSLQPDLYGYRGVRLTLKLKEIRDSGNLLETIRSRTKQSGGEGAAIAVKFVASFEIVEERPLV